MYAENVKIRSVKFIFDGAYFLFYSMLLRIFDFPLLTSLMIHWLEFAYVENFK